MRPTPDRPLCGSDPFSRRVLLRGGAAFALASLAPSRDPLAPPLRGPRRRATAKNVILLWLNGGPSHLDTFDLKPGTKYAGAFAPIATDVDGLQISEHLPQLARRCRHLAIVRSLTSVEADHVRADHLMHTGHAPAETVAHPWFLSVAAQELVAQPGALPASVAIGYALAGGGCLGEEHSPFVVASVDAPASDFRLPDGLARGRHSRRLELLDELDGDFAARTDRARVEASAAVRRRAAALMGEDAAKAFDLAAEPEEARARYGETPFGRGILLARRLVQHGVRYVEVMLDNWDTHGDNFNLTQQLLAQLDPAFSALLDDLDGDGRLSETLVLCTGEFGRTPEINKDNGRDHHAAAFSAVLAGGGVRGGQVIGATNESGHEVKDRPVTPCDLLASIYVALGLDPRATYHTCEGRPIRRLDAGEPVRELFA